jgi:hypothetical protein
MAHVSRSFDGDLIQVEVNISPQSAYRGHDTRVEEHVHVVIRLPCLLKKMSRVSMSRETISISPKRTPNITSRDVTSQ